MDAMQLRTGHIGLNVSDLNRSLQFYQEVLGFDLIQQSEAQGKRYAFLGYGDDLVLTLWQQSTGTAEYGRPGLHHLSFGVPSFADLQTFADRLSRLGIPLLYEGIVAHREGGSSVAVFFTDPDGIRLEINSPAAPDAATAPSGSDPACGFF